MRVSEFTVGGFLEALGEKTPAPASGAAAALTGAMGAALAELAGQFAGDHDAVAEARRLRTRLTELADEDAEAYAAFMHERSPENRERIVVVPREIAAAGDAVAAIADRLADELNSAVVGDAEVGRELGRAASRSATRLAEINQT